MPKDKNRNKVEDHFTQQQSEHPVTGNKNPKYGMTQEVPSNADGENDSEIFSKQVDRQTSLDDLS